MRQVDVAMVSFAHTVENMKIVEAANFGENFEHEIVKHGNMPRRVDMTLNEFCNLAETLGFADYDELIKKLADCGEWDKAVTF